MKIVSWNVAGYRAVLNKGFDNFFREVDADIFCMQEVKATNEQVDFKREGYYYYLNTAEKKGYSGTAIYTKDEPLGVFYGMGIDEHDHEGRMITLEYDEFYLITSYVPNVKRDLSRLDYRMSWEDEFLKYIKALEVTKPVIVCGDFNVAHQEIDIKNARANVGHAGFTNEERSKMTKLLNNGFVDTFRYLYPEKETYSWWSYMFQAREKNVGWRIDYFFISESLKEELKDAIIYSNVFGSDHCPIGIEIF